VCRLIGRSVDCRLMGVERTIYTVRSLARFLKHTHTHTQTPIHPPPPQTMQVLALAKEYNLGLMGAKWQNTFLSAQQLRELKSEAVYRGEVLGLFATVQREVVQALNLHHEKETGTGPAAEGAEAGADGAGKS
jgi:hypothetical protein